MLAGGRIWQDEFAFGNEPRGGEIPPDDELGASITSGFQILKMELTRLVGIGCWKKNPFVFLEMNDCVNSKNSFVYNSWIQQPRRVSGDELLRLLVVWMEWKQMFVRKNPDYVISTWANREKIQVITSLPLREFLTNRS